MDTEGTEQPLKGRVDAALHVFSMDIPILRDAGSHLQLALNSASAAVTSLHLTVLLGIQLPTASTRAGNIPWSLHGICAATGDPDTAPKGQRV